MRIITMKGQENRKTIKQSDLGKGNAMKIGVIGPMKEEIFPFIEKYQMTQWKRVSMITVYRGNIGKMEVYACQCGICKTNVAVAAQLLIRECGMDQMILSGVAGALNPDLEIGDIVVSNALIHHDVEEHILKKFPPFMESSWIFANPEMVKICLQSYTLGTEEHDFEKIRRNGTLDDRKRNFRCISGKIASGETFIDLDKREHILQKFNPDCVDMESAAFAQVCYLNEIPFVVIRAISDKANGDSYENFIQNYKHAAKNSLQVVETYIAHYNNFC